MKLTLLGLAAAIAGTTVVTLVRQASPVQSLTSGSRVALAGSVESREVEVANEVAGRIVSFPLAEGSAVRPGDVLVALDDGDARLRLARIGATLRVAEAALDDLRSRPRKEELALALSRLTEQDLDLARVRADLERMHRAATLVSPADMDAATAACRLSEQRLATANRELDLLKAGARQAEIDGAQARVDELAREVDLAARELAKCEIKAPLAATVLRKNFEAGELAAAGSHLVTLLDTTETWVELAADERLLGRIALGEKAEIRAERGEARAMGRVSFIADKHGFTPRDALTLDERSKLTYRVKVAVDAPPPPWLKPGMFVEVVLGGAAP